MLDLGQNGQMVGVDENVPAVFQRSQQRQRLLKVEIDALWCLLGRWRHAGERSGRGRRPAGERRRALDMQPDGCLTELRNQTAA